MEWMKIVVSKDDIAVGRMSEIQNAFDTLFMAAGSPEDVAMFGRSRFDVASEEEAGNGNDDGGDHEVLCFSPAATQLARNMILRYDGRPCNQPGRSALLVGHQTALRLLKGFRG
jgi:hypothetical protein